MSEIKEYSVDEMSAYNIEFINSVELCNIRFIEASFNSSAAKPSLEGQIEIAINTDWKPSGSGFTAIQSLSADFLSKDTPIGNIACKLELVYSTTLNSSDEKYKQIINAFTQTSVPFNAWAYLREFIHNALFRMDWPPFILPLLKQRIVIPNANTDSEEKTEQKE